jgi:hypothetical protein
VQLDGSREGILIDLSAGGALPVMAMSPPRDNRFRLTIEWKNTMVASPLGSCGRSSGSASSNRRAQGLQRFRRVPRHGAPDGRRDPAHSPHYLAARRAATRGRS